MSKDEIKEIMQSGVLVHSEPVLLNRLKLKP
jgi:hypothetical protein